MSSKYAAPPKILKCTEPPGLQPCAREVTALQNRRHPKLLGIPRRLLQNQPRKLYCWRTSKRNRPLSGDDCLDRPQSALSLLD